MQEATTQDQISRQASAEEPAKRRQWQAPALTVVDVSETNTGTGTFIENTAATASAS